MKEPITTVKTDLICKMERNFISQFRGLSGIKGTTFREDDVITEFFSGYSTSWMNSVMKADGGHPQLRELISNTLSKYANRCPMLWHVGALTNEPQLLRQALIDQGLQFTGIDAGMELDLSKFSNSKELPEFTVQTVHTQDKVGDWLIPFADAYELSDEVIDHFQQFMRSRVEHSNIEGWFTGYVDNLPVSSAYYLADNEVVMLYAVGTVAGARHRGYGRRIVEAAINHARQHSSYPIGLYASEMGYPLYKDMGFVDVCGLEHYAFTPAGM